jgi:hypothetical protein
MSEITKGLQPLKLQKSTMVSKILIVIFKGNNLREDKMVFSAIQVEY